MIPDGSGNAILEWPDQAIHANAEAVAGLASRASTETDTRSFDRLVRLRRRIALRQLFKDDGKTPSMIDR